MPLGDLGDGDPICKEQVYRGLRWPGRDSTPFELIRGESLLSISIHQLDRQGRERVIHRAVEGAAAGALVGFMVWHGTGQLLLGGSILVFFASLGAGIGLQEAWRLPESSPLVLDRSANQVTLGGHRICRVNDVARLEHRLYAAGGNLWAVMSTAESYCLLADWNSVVLEPICECIAACCGVELTHHVEND